MLRNILYKLRSLIHLHNIHLDDFKPIYNQYDFWSTS